MTGEPAPLTAEEREAIARRWAPMAWMDSWSWNQCADVQRLLAALDAADAENAAIAKSLRYKRAQLHEAEARLADARREALEEAARAVDKALSYAPYDLSRHQAGDIAERAINQLRAAPRTTEPPPQGEFSHVTHCGCPECRPTEETTT